MNIWAVLTFLFFLNEAFLGTESVSYLPGEYLGVEVLCHTVNLQVSAKLISTMVGPFDALTLHVLSIPVDLYL